MRYGPREVSVVSTNMMSTISQKIKIIKVGAKRWIKEKKVVECKDIIDIETSLQHYNDPLDPLYFYKEYIARITELEGRRNNIMKSQEDKIRMKSRAI